MSMDIMFQANCIFNTSGLLNTIEKYNPIAVIINFYPNIKTIPKISTEIEKLIKVIKGKYIIASSTSGSAGNDYEFLINEWKEYFKASS